MQIVLKALRGVTPFAASIKYFFKDYLVIIGIDAMPISLVFYIVMIAKRN